MIKDALIAVPNPPLLDSLPLTESYKGGRVPHPLYFPPIEPIGEDLFV